jgi:hypothetical protein
MALRFHCDASRPGHGAIRQERGLFKVWRSKIGHHSARLTQCKAAPILTTGPDNHTFLTSSLFR